MPTVDCSSCRSAAPSCEQVRELMAGTHRDPHALLGAHAHPAGTTVRALRPDASSVDALMPDGARYPLARVHPGGLFCGLVPGPARPHRLAVRAGGREFVVDDGYRRPPTLGPDDLRLIGAGGHRRLWEVLGAHRREDGVSFTVWAPNAGGLRVRGDFNGWHGASHPMRRLGPSGVWEVFVPDVPEGSRYRFEVLGADGRWREKADPMAFRTECPPDNASVVFTSRHVWGDQAWLAERARTDWASAPVSVYEMHLGSWSAAATGYRAAAGPLVDYLRRTGFTHVQLLPLAEHPFGGSWGYQTTSYYAPTARYGDPDGLRHLVDTLHRAGIGVLFDFVPAHFPRDEWALARFDGTALYEYADPRLRDHPDWGTFVFDFGRNEVRNFLVASALYWIEEFHADGLRVDAVSSMLYLDYSRAPGQWVPNVHGGRENLEAIGLLRELTGAVHEEHPGVRLIAEESTAWPGVTSPDGLGFDFKWNMGWMHDTLEYFRLDPVLRAGRHHQLTFGIAYAWDERFMLPLSHDEVVHGKGSLWDRMPGDEAAKAAGVRALLAYMWAHPGKQLLFMGGEFGQPTEWDALAALPWELVRDGSGSPYHRGVQRLVADLNAAYRDLRALYSLDCDPSGFEWITDREADANVLAFLRTGDDGSTLACVANFAGVGRPRHRIGLPTAGTWSVVVDTDRARYSGAGPDRPAGVRALALPWHGRPASAEVDLPPSSVRWLLSPPIPAVSPPRT